MRFFSNDKESTEQSNVDVQNPAASDDRARTDETLTDAARTDEARTDEARTDEARTEAARTEAARTDEARPDGARTDEARPDQPVAGQRPDLPPDQSPGDPPADGTDHVQSEPVPVPAQRIGSPWSNAPGTPDDNSDAELSDRERTDGTDEPGDSGIDERAGARPFGEAAGPSSGAGAAAVSPTERDGDHDAHDLGGGRMGGPAEQDRDRTDLDRSDLDRSDLDRTDLDRTDLDRTDLDRTDVDRTDLDRADRDRADRDRTDLDRTDLDRTDLDRTDEARDDATTGTAAMATAGAAGATGAAAGAAAGTVSRPGGTTSPELGPIFDASEGQSLRERWREVQLRFVDSPREAATEAAGLVDEAVDKLTSRLRGHKDLVSHDSDDTEELRIALRGYRDILDRILGL